MIDGKGGRRLYYVRNGSRDPVSIFIDGTLGAKRGMCC